MINRGVVNKTSEKMKGQSSLEQEWLEIIKPNSLNTIIGAPGSGKSVLALYLAETVVKNRGGQIFMYGIPEENRDRYQGHVEFLDTMQDPSEAPNDGVLIIEEASQSAHSRTSMSKENLLLGRLKNIRRHKGLTIIVVVQRGMEVDKNLAESTDVLLVKKPETFQPLSDRIQFRPHLQEAQRLYANPKINPLLWVYVSTLGRLVRNRRPSYWTEAISTSLGPSRMEGRRPPYQMGKRERIVEAMILQMEGKSSRESGCILGRSHTTILSYLGNYPNSPRSRLPDEEFEALRRQAKAEFTRRSGKQAPVETEPEMPEEDGWSEEPESVSARAVSYGRCQTGHELQDEDGKRSPFCTQCGTQVSWGHTVAQQYKSVAEQYQSQRTHLESFRKREDGKRDEKMENLKSVAAVGVGVGVGIAPLFGIDLIDKRIDETGWDENTKSQVKWIVRFVDLGFGIAGTAANALPIAKGEGKLHNYGLLGASADQIVIGGFKIVELAREEPSPMPMEEPVRDWRENPMVKELLSRQEEEPKEPEEVEQTEEGVEEVEQTSGMKQTLDISGQDADDILDTCKRVLDIVESDEISAEDKRDCMERALAMLESLEGCSILN